MAARRTSAEKGRSDTSVKRVSTAPEDVVRAYLEYLVDPTSMIDAGHIEQLEERYRAATDPIDKLRIAAALEAARQPDGGGLAEGFVQHAKAWAEAEGIPPTAFSGAGVPDDVLRRAGLRRSSKTARTSRTGRTGRTSRAPKATSSRAAGTERRARVTVDDIKSWALSQSEPFTIKRATEQLGGSLVTAKKALVELVESGRLHDVGADPQHRGPGRAPSRFSTTRPRKTRAAAAAAES